LKHDVERLLDICGALSANVSLATFAMRRSLIKRKPTALLRIGKQCVHTT
jgi:hypothetical protein